MKNFRMVVLLVLVAVLGVASGFDVDVLSEDVSHSYLTQSETESVLRSETLIRRYLIFTLSKTRNELKQNQGYHDVIDEIVHDLQTRKVNPVKFLPTETNGQPDVTPKLQDNDCEKATAAKRMILVRMIPKLPIETYSVINSSFSTETITKLKNEPGNLVVKVLESVREKRIQLNNQLLADILYNYPYEQFTVDFDVILNDVVETLEKTPVNFTDFEPPQSSNENILIHILGHVSNKHPRMLSEFMGPIVLPDKIRQIVQTPKLSDLFVFMSDYDYPEDVTTAKYALFEWVRKNEELFQELTGILEPYTPSKKLLGLLTYLTLPSQSRDLPVLSEAKVVHAHYKLRFLSYSGQFFKPSLAKDIEFLLSSFVTKSEEVEEASRPVKTVFDTPDFYWQETLEEFDFGEYTQPRPLMLDILRKLLQYPTELPVGAAKTFNKFIQEATDINDCPMTESFAAKQNKFGYEQEPPVAKPCGEGTLVQLIDLEPVVSLPTLRPYAKTLQHIIDSEPVFALMHETPNVIGALEMLLNQVFEIPLNTSDILGKVLKSKIAFSRTNYTKVCVLNVDMKRNVLKCPGAALLIDEYSIIELVKNDPSYEFIKSLVLLQPLHYKDYTNEVTREDILRKILRTRLPNFNGDIKINEKGKLKPLVRQRCTTLTPMDKCNRTSIATMVDPYDMIGAIEAEVASHYSDIIFAQASHRVNIFSTRMEALRAIFRNKDVPTNERAALPPHYITICKPYDPLDCDSDQSLQKVISPDSLLEIVDNNKEEIKEILDEYPLLALKFIVLKSRAKILRYFLRQLYLGTKGRVVNVSIMNITENLVVNNHGNLPPTFEDKCVTNPKKQPMKRDNCPQGEYRALIYDTDALFEDLNVANVKSLQNQARKYFIPYDGRYNRKKLLDLLLKLMGHKTLEYPNIEKELTSKNSCVPLNLHELEPNVGPRCPDIATHANIIDPSMIIKELAPSQKFQSIIKSLPIPIGVPTRFTNYEIVEHMGAHMTEKVRKEYLEMVKDKFPKTRLNETLPYVFFQCLSNNPRQLFIRKKIIQDVNHLQKGVYAIDYSSYEDEN